MPEKGEANLNDGTVNPYGKDLYMPNPVNELFVRITQHNNNNNTFMFGHDEDLGMEIGKYFFEAKDYRIKDITNENNKQAYMSISGDFTGDGLNNQLITLGSKYSDDTSQL